MVLFLSCSFKGLKCINAIVKCDDYESINLFEALEASIPSCVTLRPYSSTEYGFLCQKNLLSIKFKRMPSDSLEFIYSLAKSSLSLYKPIEILSEHYFSSENYQSYFLKVQGRWNSGSKFTETWSRLYVKIEDDVYQVFIKYPSSEEDNFKKLEEEMMRLYMEVVYQNY